MFYFKLVTLKFDFKMDVLNQPKSYKFPKRSLNKLNTGHLTRNVLSHLLLHYEAVNCAYLLFNIHCETAQI